MPHLSRLGSMWTGIGNKMKEDQPTGKCGNDPVDTCQRTSTADTKTDETSAEDLAGSSLRARTFWRAVGVVLAVLYAAAFAEAVTGGGQ